MAAQNNGYDVAAILKSWTVDGSYNRGIEATIQSSIQNARHGSAIRQVLIHMAEIERAKKDYETAKRVGDGVEECSAKLTAAIDMLNTIRNAAVEDFLDLFQVCCIAHPETMAAAVSRIEPGAAAAIAQSMTPFAELLLRTIERIMTSDAWHKAHYESARQRIEDLELEAINAQATALRLDKINERLSRIENASSVVDDDCPPSFEEEINIDAPCIEDDDDCAPE